MTAYVLTRAADADLAEIARYTIQHWGDARAEAYLLDLHAAFTNLAAFPDAGRPVIERAGYRRIESGSHTVFYRQESPDVLIVRVLHQRMDPMRRLADWP